MMDNIVLVYWYAGNGVRQLLAFENQERADAFMNAHPYRRYWFVPLKWEKDRVYLRPQTWFPQ